MAPSSSSTKKAAKLAQKGKGQKVRFQNGTLFPVIVALVIVLGIGLVTYARQSRPAADASAPTVNDHWHHTYGFFLCDEWVQLEGDGEARDVNGRPTNVAYARTGIHSHDDGLIHWHPFSSASVGRRATLGVFLNTYDVDLTNDTLQFPEDQRAQLPAAFSESGLIDEDDSTCTVDGEEESAQLQVVRWDNISDSDNAGTTFIAGFDDIGLNQDAMAIVIAFVPDGTDVVKPPWNNDFDQSVLNDTNQARPDQLFPDVEVDEDGNVTVGESELDQEDVGPAVDELDDVEADEEFDAPVDEPETTDAPDASEE
ncbi:MAG: hypothetical protein AB8G26_19850 [Ilumatobacter sp.]